MPARKRTQGVTQYSRRSAVIFHDAPSIWAHHQLISDANRKLVKLDLSEVTLVDLNVVRFLGDQERWAVELVKCSPYIREWIQREKAANSVQREDDPESKEGE